MTQHALMALLLLGITAFGSPPPAPVHIFATNYFGRELRDPYRWMERTGDAEYKSWLTEQNGFAKTYLERLPRREALIREVAEADAQLNFVPAGLQVRKGRLFYFKTPPPSQSLVLFSSE